jgi:flagellar basal-body rod protein FlgB
MINSDAFSYINLLDRSLDASSKRETIISNNLANVDTPGYKRKDIDFEKELQHAILHSGHTSIDRAVKETTYSKVRDRLYYDHAGYSYRLDENNVDVDTENVELASEEIRYQTLAKAASNEIKDFSVVAKGQ